jgi:hypothetical protein
MKIVLFALSRVSLTRLLPHVRRGLSVGLRFVVVLAISEACRRRRLSVRIKAIGAGVVQPALSPDLRTEPAGRVGRPGETGGRACEPSRRARGERGEVGRRA